mmetsp:Transcript_66675/g.132110  ORF Transcript_66675/g.132110 Transcript_66675/m.132110 type:complete len:112 (-) Transcript_66675:234-569(-)|eukprot:CAMPEP_0174734866 /NCGR_PEP_ID=MMETSP1094-20130205/64040_1 /TAXON_ID=156173 /ORGANISM="Chrysochromulina brevifilum, Strain UTEX LB 985" /LENGTH=111 /DNA_ID=CAMNT_0015937761 /DNA_START=1 /DNA_END=336 /DNA_ORIENTATION=-
MGQSAASAPLQQPYSTEAGRKELTKLVTQMLADAEKDFAPDESRLGAAASVDLATVLLSSDKSTITAALAKMEEELLTLTLQRDLLLQQRELRNSMAIVEDAGKQGAGESG